MEYRNLGQCGLKVSELCLGTLTFGRYTDAAEAGRIVDLALDAGVTFFDTADAYSNGTAEEILGRAIQAHRKDAVIASKFFNPMGQGPNDGGMSRVHIMQSVENSLRRLGMDYLDIFYIHHIDEEAPLEEALRALDDLVRQGKVRYIACSNYEAWRLLEGLWISETKNLNRFVCYQPLYNLVVRDIEQEIVPVCQRKGVGIVAYSPLANGFLSGKYQPGMRSLAGTRSEEGWNFLSNSWSPAADVTLKELLACAMELGRTPAQVAIRWVLEQPMVSSAIVGARNVAQARDNLAAGGWALPAEIKARLDAVSAPTERYPVNIEHFFRKRRADAIRK